LRAWSASCDTVSVGRSWAELRVTLGTEHLDIVSSFLIDAGAPGVEVRESPAGAEVVAYFSGEPPIPALRQLLADLQCAPNGIATRRIDDEAWGETWKHHCRPQRIGDRLYVCPSWEAEGAPPDRVSIIIDPGMAFGTGDHPTTRNCLRLAEDLAGRKPLGRVLDCGTGSGILAIAAAKLGAIAVWAVDTDPVARDITTANGAVNGVVDRLHIADSIDAVAGPFDVILANLFADLLAALAPRFRALLSADGFLICAGFLLGDAGRVEAAFSREGLHLARRIDEDGWVTVALHAGAA